MSITFSKRKVGGTNLLFLSRIFRLFIQIWTLIKNILLHQFLEYFLVNEYFV